MTNWPMTKSRLKLGFTLLAIGGVGFAGIFAADLIWGDPHSVTIANGSTGNVLWAASEFKVNSVVSQYYLIPFVLCGLAGMVCLLWPTRKKPPKL